MWQDQEMDVEPEGQRRPGSSISASSRSSAWFRLIPKGYQASACWV